MNMMTNIVRVAEHAEVSEIPADAAAGGCGWKGALAAYERAKRRYGVALEKHSTAEGAHMKELRALQMQRQNGVSYGIGDTVESAQARYKATVADIERREDELREKFSEHETTLEKASGRHHSAFHEMLRTHTPDLRGAVIKLELAIEYGCEVADLDGLLEDLKRLAGLKTRIN